MRHLLVLLSAISVLLKHCTTQDISCTGTQDDTGTFYRAQWNETNCQGMWLNSGGYTIAHHQGKSDEVISYSNTTLFIRGCYTEVTLILDCSNQGELVSHTANCTVTCSERRALPSKGTPRKRWPLLVPVLCVIVVVGIFAVIWRIRSN